MMLCRCEEMGRETSPQYGQLGTQMMCGSYMWGTTVFQKHKYKMCAYRIQIYGDFLKYLYLIGHVQNTDRIVTCHALLHTYMVDSICGERYWYRRRVMQLPRRRR